MRKKPVKKRLKKLTSHDFLASMSHEIRTPINGILGISSILQDMQMPDDQKKFIRLINNSVQSLLSLINDILDFSKIEAGKMPIIPKAFCIQSEMNNILETFKPIADKKKIRLSLNITNKPIHFLIGDLNRIKQILLNLIGNSLKFTEKGEVMINVQFSAIDELNTKVKFSVIDTGIGISHEKMQTLFNPYMQAHDIRVSGSGGTGLGLYISKKLSQMMKGELSAKSQFGKGSEFIFELPLLLDTQIVSLVDRKAKDHVRITGRILLAEDNFINQMVTEKFLKKSGLDVVVVNNGKEAIEILEKDQSFDLVLMDCHMPILDGYRATMQIRKSGKPYSAIPILALTASVLKQEQEHCKAVGMDDFISKPVTYEVLQGKLKEWLLEVSQNTVKDAI